MLQVVQWQQAVVLGVLRVRSGAPLRRRLPAAAPALAALQRRLAGGTGRLDSLWHPPAACGGCGLGRQHPRAHSSEPRNALVPRVSLATPLRSDCTGPRLQRLAATRAGGCGSVAKSRTARRANKSGRLPKAPGGLARLGRRSLEASHMGGPPCQVSSCCLPALVTLPSPIHRCMMSDHQSQCPGTPCAPPLCAVAAPHVAPPSPSSPVDASSSFRPTAVPTMVRATATEGHRCLSHRRWHHCHRPYRPLPTVHLLDFLSCSPRSPPLHPQVGNLRPVSGGAASRPLPQRLHAGPRRVGGHLSVRLQHHPHLQAGLRCGGACTCC